MQGNSAFKLKFHDFFRFSLQSSHIYARPPLLPNKLRAWGRRVSRFYAANPKPLNYINGKRFVLFQVHATTAETDQPKWWEKNAGPNMVDINSTQEFLDALSQAGERLVIVEFYGTWCASCRALFPKLCKLAEEYPEILIVKVNFDENKTLCKSLNVKVLPYFHFYRGADGLLESFSCSLAKLQKLRDAITRHNTTAYKGTSFKGPD